MTEKISKTLSPNDLGETGGHQAGILVPKKEDILDFFPHLDPTIKNPRENMSVDYEGKTYVFHFIYYNGKLFGGTRNEYRLTGMTRFFKDVGLKSGDTIIMEKDKLLNYLITIAPKKNESESGCLVITSLEWKTIKIRA